MAPKHRTFLNWTLLILLVAAVAVAAWYRRAPSGQVAVVRYPKGIMGTVCTLACVVERGEESRAEAVLIETEKEIRRLETLLSSWLDHSEITKLNQAVAGEVVPLSPETLDVFLAAREATVKTDGAFDPTCRPLLVLWKKSQEEGHPPTAEAISTARAESSWEAFALSPTGMKKTMATASIDLGGIAKGAVIDRALEMIRKGGFSGGLVDIGGDLRCFGTQPGRKPFEAKLENPFEEGKEIKIPLHDQAVCTSGDYARHVDIAGKRYSHIVDPRTGEALTESPCVSVIAPTAQEADIWATALSVLGSDGFERLPEGFEAMLIYPDGKVVKTQGFP